MDFSALDRFLDSLISDKGFPMFDTTVHVKYKEVYRRQGGFIDLDARRTHLPDTTYNIYSCSKPITCTAALTLMEQGRFLLSDPVSDYLPEFADVRVGEKQPDGSLTLRPPKRPITIRDLFTMTAGLSYNLGHPAIRAAVEKTGGHAPTREIVRAIAEMPLLFDPGEKWNYSLCHDVLGALIEVISGVPFGEYVRRTVFEPLGMTHSSYRASDALLASMAQQYRFNNDHTALETVGRERCAYRFGDEYESGGAGVISTAEDYIRFGDMLSNGGVGANGARILASDTIELMRTDFLNEKQFATFGWRQMIGYSYGLGVRTMIDRAAGGSIAPLGEFGWGGAAGALMFFDPSSGTAVYHAQHTLNPMEEYVLPRLRNVVFACLGR